MIFIPIKQIIKIYFIILFYFYLSQKSLADQNYRIAFLHTNNLAVESLNINDIEKKINKKLTSNKRILINHIIIKNTNVAEEQILRLLKNKNYKLIIATDFMFSDILYKLSYQYPNIYFYSKNHLKHRFNYNSYKIRYYEMAYLLSKKQKKRHPLSYIGVVAENKNPSNISIINAIALGSRSAKELSNIKLYFVKHVDIKTNIKNIIKIFKHKKFKTIFYLTNKNALIETFNQTEKEKIVISNTEILNIRDRNQSAFKIDYETFFLELITSVINKGKYDKRWEHLGLRGDYVKINSSIFETETIQKDIISIINRIKSLDPLIFQNVFVGPLKNTNKTIKLGKDYFMKQRDLEDFNWLLEDFIIKN